MSTASPRRRAGAVLPVVVGRPSTTHTGRSDSDATSGVSAAAAGTSAATGPAGPAGPSPAPATSGSHCAQGVNPSSFACDHGMSTASVSSSAAQSCRWYSGRPSTTQTLRSAAAGASAEAGSGAATGSGSNGSSATGAAVGTSVTPCAGSSVFVKDTASPCGVASAGTESAASGVQVPQAVKPSSVACAHGIGSDSVPSSCVQLCRW